MRICFATLCLCLLVACGGGGSGVPSPSTMAPVEVVDPGSAGNEAESGTDNGTQQAPGLAALSTRESTSRFLSQATFGATPAAIDRLTGTPVSSWVGEQFSAEPSDYLAMLNEYQSRLGYLEFNPWNEASTTFAFWRAAIGGEDQLRQRMVYALSQLLVVSNAGGDQLTDIPEATAYHQALLTRHAFGNYRDLLEDITWSPGMGFYLTYMGNQKGDPETGRTPDENYARELLQLFTIGLVELAADGSAVIGGDGKPVELYTNEDITGLARVFTGLDRTVIWEDGGEDPEVLQSWREPMVVYPELHSSREKRFLGLTIPAGTNAEDSIAIALDHIFDHPNVGPFLARQLIQRFTTSDPAPAYVARVATAFDSGRYTLPDGTDVGEGRKGDLAATIAAILLDPENLEPTAPERFGKLREPVLRFTHWARAFRAGALTPEYTTELWDLSSPSLLAQHPFRSPSVFNFYRPGFVPPGTESGGLAMTVPEFQITNAASIPGYLNFMTFFVFGRTAEADLEEYAELAAFAEVDFDPELARGSFLPDYTRELALASDSDALIDHLALVMTAGELSAQTRNTLEAYLSRVSFDEDDDPAAQKLRVQLAIMLLLGAPDYLIQR